jgi:hypothetical protein
MNNMKKDDQPTPLRSLDDLMAGVQAAAATKASARAERRAHFARVKPHPTSCVVAWVDLLGFREQICKASTPEEFQAAFRRLRDVQEEFDKDTASDDPNQAELNANSGIKVIALSDGLVITLEVSSDCLDAEISSFYDRMLSFLESLRLAQARCASVGNLVRGGIAVGYFWFQEDILLSPALVQAYYMESKIAKNPVIVLHRKFADELRAQKANAGYRDEIDPMRGLFRDCEWLEEQDQSEYVMLDFMPVFLFDDDPVPFLRAYRQQLIDGREAAPEGAHPKYDWLMQYAKEFVRSEIPRLETSIFDSPPSGGTLNDRDNLANI